MHMLRTTIALLVLVFVFACGKDDDPPPPLATNDQIVGNWKITAIQQNPLVLDFDRDGTPDKDVLPHIELCSRDDIAIYLANGSYSEEQGPTKCSYSNSPVKLTSTWTLKENGTLLLSGTKVGKILEISATTMRVQESTFLGGINFIGIVTYTKF